MENSFLLATFVFTGVRLKVTASEKIPNTQIHLTEMTPVEFFMQDLISDLCYDSFSKLMYLSTKDNELKFEPNRKLTTVEYFLQVDLKIFIIRQGLLEKFLMVYGTIGPSRTFWSFPKNLKNITLCPVPWD